MTASDYLPGRGDLVWTNFDPTRGREQAGRRPALVVSPAPFTRNTGLAIVCPITSRVRPVPTSVVMPPGLSIAGEILTSHIRGIDTPARPIRCAGATVPDGIARLERVQLDTLTTICEPDLRHGPSNPVQGAPGPLGECDNRPPRELA